MLTKLFKNLSLLWVILPVLLSFVPPVWANVDQIQTAALQKQLAALEKASGGRLGVYAIDTANGKQFQYRAHERFPMGSTAKVMVVGAILSDSMKHPYLLDLKVHYTPKELTEYAPVTRKHLADGMTIAQLCSAAMTLSDNTAMNILVKQLGGAKAVNIFARSIEDHGFRLDRREPTLGSAIPGDQRDTTTPAAMAKSLKKLVLTNTLGVFQRQQLQHWLKNSLTGNARIRAGVPKGWVVGDKTGTGQYGTTNDIAIIWPPGHLPMVMAIYFTQNKPSAAARSDVVAEATRILISALSIR